jgi:hypothetical protein
LITFEEKKSDFQVCMKVPPQVFFSSMAKFVKDFRIFEKILNAIFLQIIKIKFLHFYLFRNLILF